MPILVGGGSDGATVNISNHNGLMGLTQQSVPWLNWSWCCAHRLELARKDALSSNFIFTDRGHAPQIVLPL